jgi:hypothetical protein
VAVSDEAPKYVTNAELDAKLDKLPSRWEVRSLILAAVVVTNFHIPTEATVAAAAVAAGGLVLKLIYATVGH